MTERNAFVRNTALFCFALVATACAPGFSIDPVSVTPSTVTLAYTHTYEQEYSAVVKRAEAECQRYGRHARPSAAPVRTSLDRSVATFDCVP